MAEGLKRTAELTQLLKAVVESLNSADVSYAILRNHEELPQYTRHDLDILVEKGSMSAAAKSISHAAKDVGWIRVADMSQLDCRSLFFVHSNTATAQYMTVDLVIGLPWGWLPTVRTDNVLRTRVTSRGFSVASEGCDAAMRLAKEIFRRTTPKSNAQRIIVAGARRDPDGFAACFDGLISSSLTSEMLRHAQSGDIAALCGSSQKWRRSLIWRYHLQQPFTAAWRLVRYFTTDRRRWHGRSIGTFIAFVGPDGSGKTSLADGLHAGMGELLFKGCKRFHMHFGHLPTLGTISTKLTGKRPTQIDFTQKHAGSDVEPHPTWRSILYLVYYTMDFALGHLTVRRAKSRGCLLIFDRYFYDYYFQKRNRRLPNWLIRTASYLVPKPDIAIRPTASASYIYRRKPELDEAEIRIQLKIADSVISALPPYVAKTSIDTTCAPHDAIGRAESAIASLLTGRKGSSRE